MFIKHVNRTKLLINNKLTPTGNVVGGTIKRDKKDDVVKYEVDFKVRGKGTFTTDPKIKSRN